MPPTALHLPRLIEEERVRDACGDGPGAVVVLIERIGDGATEPVRHVAADSALVQRTAFDPVVGRPSQLLAVQVLLARFAERVIVGLISAIDGDERAARPCWFGSGGGRRRLRPSRRFWRLSRGARGHHAQQDETESCGCRSHCTPTAVHAWVTALSTLLPGYSSRAAWIVAARAVENVAFDGSMKTNAR